ncbi:MAG: ester cyclase [Actinomycetota bacterium]|nr:ester cyclase [Actinomycetota bacterium]
MDPQTDGDDMKAVLRRHFEEVLNLGRVDVIDELYSEDYVLDAPFSADGTPEQHATTSGRDGLRERVGLFRTAFPDIVFSVEELLAEGGSAVARYVFRGTHLGPFGDLAATGRTMSVTGILVAHFRAGTIYEAFSEFDSGDMMRQLVPASASAAG